MDQYSGSIDPSLVAEPQEKQMSEAEFNEMMQGIESDESISNGPAYTSGDDFDSLASAPAGDVYQPQQGLMMQFTGNTQMPPEPAADNYHPLFGWWNAAGPYQAGAHYNRAIGWYLPVAPAPSVMSTPVKTAVNTPQQMQPPSQFAPQLLMPPAPMYSAQIPSGPLHAPMMATPQPRTRSQTPRSAPAPKPAPKSAPKPKSAGKPKGKSTNKKLSLDRACTCKPHQAQIKRPPNKFIVYRKMVRMQVSRELGTTDNGVISKETGTRWAHLPAHEQAKYAAIADRLTAEHKAAHPNWKFAPGNKNALDFGDESCTCGAYQANKAYRAMRDAQGGSTSKAPCKKAARPSYAMDVDEPEEDMDDYDPEVSDSEIPIPPPRRASKKRKQPPTPESDEMPASKRPTREASKGKFYAEPNETDIPSAAPLSLPPQAQKTLPIRRKSTAKRPSTPIRRKSTAKRPSPISTSRHQNFQFDDATLGPEDNLFGEGEGEDLFAGYFAGTEDDKEWIDYNAFINASPIEPSSRRSSRRKSSPKSPEGIRKSSRTSSGSRRSARIFGQL